MPFLIGTDEAGYGPNLGPLTITGTLWETENLEVDLYDLLNPVVSSRSSRNQTSRTIQIADSKRVYQSSGSIRNLETNVLAILSSVFGFTPTNWQQLVEMVCPPESLEHLVDQVWLRDQSLAIPVKSIEDETKQLGEAFLERSNHVGVRLVEIQCLPIFPLQFNRMIDDWGNKATLLSVETLKIVQRLKNRTDDDLEIGCDKHGGRSKYASLIEEYVTDSVVLTGMESSNVSDYSFREHDRDVTMRFQAKGESFLPTALASMVSKYIREVFMLLWNRYWLTQIPNLKPTKGYPVDARRFKSEIASVQMELGIADRAIWRVR